MATITVRGIASVPTEPDEATVALTLSAEADTPDAAYRAVAERSAELERVFEELGIDRAHRSTAGVSVQPQHDWIENRNELRGYLPTAQTHVRMRESTTVASLLEQSVTRAGAQLQGPWWSVDLENPARLEACRKAAAAAAARAEAYADSLGLRLGGLQSAVEAGATRPNTASFSTLAAADVEIPVQPGEQRVTATIELTFEVT
jgi:uncharacterized protein YggE